MARVDGNMGRIKGVLADSNRSLIEVSEWNQLGTEDYLFQQAEIKSPGRADKGWAGRGGLHRTVLAPTRSTVRRDLEAGRVIGIAE